MPYNAEFGNYDPKDLITVKEAARLLNITDRGARWLVNYGHLKAIFVKNKWIILKQSVLIYKMATHAQRANDTEKRDASREQRIERELKKESALIENALRGMPK